MRRKNKLLFTAVGIAILLGVLGVTTISASTEFVTPTTLSKGGYGGERVNLEGSVTDLETGSSKTVFHVADANASVRVVYEKPLPDTLQNGRIVVAKGVYRDGRLVARHLSVRAHEGTTQPTSSG